MFKEVKKKILKKIKEVMITMSHQTENIYEEVEIIKKHQMKILAH